MVIGLPSSWKEGTPKTLLPSFGFVSEEDRDCEDESSVVTGHRGFGSGTRTEGPGGGTPESGK